MSKIVMSSVKDNELLSQKLTFIYDKLLYLFPIMVIFTIKMVISFSFFVNTYVIGTLWTKEVVYDTVWFNVYM